MNKRALHKLAVVVSLINLGLWPGALMAQTTTIETNVSTTASTGHQTADEEGTVTTGSASATVEIRTDVNGQHTKSVVVERESSTGEQQVEVTQTIQATDGQEPIEKTEITVNGQTIAGPAALSLNSPVHIQPVPANLTEPSAPSFFQHIWISIAQFFDKLFSLFD